MKYSLKDILDISLDTLIDFTSRIELLNTISIFDIHDKSVKVDVTEDSYIYGVKLDSTSNRKAYLTDIKTIAADIRFDISNSQVYLYYVKHEDYQAIYALSCNQSAIKQLATEFKTKMMTGKDIVLALYNIFGVGSHKQNNENRLVFSEDIEVYRDEYFIPWEVDIISGKFKAKVQNAVARNRKENTVYQATEYFAREVFQVDELFALQWEGVISMRIEFNTNALSARIRKYQSVANFGESRFAGICKAIVKGENKEVLESVVNESCIVNIIASLKDGNETSLEAISYLLGCKLEENHLNGEKVFAKTLMLTRDMDFDGVLPVSTMTQYFTSTHKRPVSKDKFVFYAGRDISGAHVDYTILDSLSPHSIFIGRTGSGKSRQAINALLQTIGYDKDKGEASRFFDFYIRYTDVGYTFSETAQRLKKKYKNEIKIFPSNVRGLRFSLFNIEVKNSKVDHDSLDFTTSFISFALDVQSGGKADAALTGGELKFLEEVITEILIKKDFADLGLSELFLDDAYANLKIELEKQGFNETHNISDLPEKYNYMKKPILDDVYTKVGEFKNRSKYSDLQVKTLESLENKLYNLFSLSFILGHSNVANSKERVTYIDFDEIKKNPTAFCIIYWMMIKNWIDVMKTEAKGHLSGGTKATPTLFFVDEAHNFFGFETFQSLFVAAVKEFRKFSGYFTFLTQELDDVPPKIVSQLGTKIFLTHPEEKSSLEKVISNAFGEVKEEDKRVIERVDDFMIFTMFDKGSVGIKFPLHPKDEKLFTPNPNI